MLARHMAPLNKTASALTEYFPSAGYEFRFGGCDDVVIGFTAGNLCGCSSGDMILFSAHQ